jgi:hypothetical protein
MVRNFLILPLVLVLVQKPAEKPKVHPDFYFGSYPLSRPAEEIMKDPLARQVLVAYHEGWSLDKISKDLKVPITDVSKMSDKVEDERLGGRRSEFDVRPFLPVVRERDYERVKDSLRQHSEAFSKLILDHWKDIETMVHSLAGAKGVPKDRVFYETVVSGILLGGMIDAFYDDKTLMPPPPRRGKTDRYYAWLVESNPVAAGRLRRELRESSGYRIVTIGTVLPEQKLNVDDLRGNSTVLEEADAQRYRAFIGIFSRDKLLPYFKTRREEFLKLGALISSGRYVAFGEFFAWYYNTLANFTADALVAAHRMAAPEKLYTYAVRVPQ